MERRPPSQRRAPLLHSAPRPREPFPPADDYKPKPKRPVNIGELYDSLSAEMTEGFQEVNARIDGLAVRVNRVEADAWRRRLVILGKALAPAALGYLAHYVPELAGHIPAFLEFINKISP